MQFRLLAGLLAFDDGIAVGAGGATGGVTRGATGGFTRGATRGFTRGANGGVTGGVG